MTPRETTSGGPGRARPSLVARLLAAHSLVVVTGALTTWLVAAILAPSVFRDHLARSGSVSTPAQTRHVEEAFASALLISLAVALPIAVAAGLVVSAYVSRRLQRAITPVTAAAAEIGAGRYRSRVPDPALGGEFTTLAAAVNALAERLETVETNRRRMLADLAHEMRTPLATIEAHLEAVEDGIRQLDDQTVGVLRGSTRRLARLAEDVVALSRAQEALDVEPRPVQGGAIARAAVQAAAGHYADKGVRLDVAAEDEDLVLADSERIGQVLTNLLDNALRHTVSSGSVRVTCRRRGTGMEFVVADTGEGIAGADLGHVFDRFYRVDSARDRTRGGSGIGLTIAQALVEAHGGEITAASGGPGRGSTFTVWLPGAG
ncbi:ATPase domain-containing protein [Nocardioides sp. CF8]|uniref:sensor histidine kinase n=1 Tax=Nocardioides sp. CF8 TaxID=110319 RepID=UPI00032DC72F|nr:HAMP domain-containing sensor histidine kinase [Nocardioides sp. CF8]EON22722.1 ATPase domain-containing protein [Nocardioides sp. CF8]